MTSKAKASQGDLVTLTLPPHDGWLHQKVEIEHQRRFIGLPCVLPSETASIPCAKLSTQGMLRELNKTLQTSHAMTSAREALLQRCIDSRYDFGLASALLRTRWNEDPVRAMEALDDAQSADQHLRENAIQGEYVKREMPPRRLWDLWSNRVIPHWMVWGDAGWVDVKAAAVSHSWVSEELRHAVDTSINSHEWPVPIPTDTTLERIRIELLNLLIKHSIHLVWLDVLCLRQAGVRGKEEIRGREWRLDVPTIGTTYRRAPKVVYYFSGLGRPFRLGDLESDRHWLNRVWTLQETLEKPRRIIGGKIPGSPLLDSPYATRELDAVQFWDTVHYVSTAIWNEKNILGPLSAVRSRSASSDLDKIAALGHCLIKSNSKKSGKTVPTYILGEDPESAWSRLIQILDKVFHTQFLALPPPSGSKKRTSMPSWQEVNELPLPRDKSSLRKLTHLLATPLLGVSGYRFDRCLLEGLDRQALNGARRGTLVLQDKRQRRFTVVARHTQSVPDGVYTVVCCHHGMRDWIVGHADEEGTIEKVSFVETERALTREDLGLTGKAKPKTTYDFV